MKKISLLILLIISFVAAALAQSGHDKISYQSVVRDGSNHLLYDTEITVAVSIANSGNPAVLYSETHTVTSNANGLISFLIGDGSSPSGNWDAVQWNRAEITMVTSVGGVVLSTHTLPLSAVPYALYAKNAGAASYADSVNINVVKHYVDQQGFLTEEVQVLSISNDTIFLTGGSWVKLPAGFSGDYNDLTNKPDLDQYATNVHLNDTLGKYYTRTQTDSADAAVRAEIPTVNNGQLTLIQKSDTTRFKANQDDNDTVDFSGYAKLDTLNAYYDTTRMKAAIHDTAEVLREMMVDAANDAKITIQKNGVEVDHFTVNQTADQEINILVPTKVTDLTDASNYVTNAKLKDTLGKYTTTNQLDTVIQKYNYAKKDTLKNFLTISGLCDSVVKCEVIKDVRDSLKNAFDTLAIFFDSTKVKSAIHDTANAIRNLIPPAANEGNITIEVVNGTVQQGMFNVNQAANQTVTITIPEAQVVNNGQLTLIAAGDTTRFTANQFLNDTMRFDKFATKDTLVNFARKDTLVNFARKDTLVNFARKDTLANFARKDTLVNFARKDTLENFATKDTLRKYYDTTLTKKAIHDTAEVLRGEFPVVNNGQITIKVDNQGTEEISTFGVNQADNQTINITIPQNVAVNDGQLTLIQKGDTTRFKANQANNDTMDISGYAKLDTLRAYYDTTQVKKAIHDSIGNGKFTIKYGDNDPVTFNANQKSDTSLIIPAPAVPNNGQLTLIQKGDTTRFKANQANNDTMDISGYAKLDTLRAYYDTTMVKKAIHDTVAYAIHDSIVNNISAQIHDSIGNGKLTIQYGTNPAVVFAANQDTNTTMIIQAPVYGTLTLTKNNETQLGTFKADETKTIDITIPKAVTDLSDGNQYLKTADLCNTIQTNCSNVALKNADNTFSGKNHFTDSVTVLSNTSIPRPATTSATECTNLNAVNVCDLLAVFDSLTNRIKKLEDKMEAMQSAMKPTTITSFEIVEAEKTTTSIKVQATASNPAFNVLSYEFCCSDCGDGVTPVCTTVTSNSYTFEGLTPYTDYHFSVKANTFMDTVDASVNGKTKAEAPTANFTTTPFPVTAGFTVNLTNIDLKGIENGTVKVSYKTTSSAADFGNETTQEITSTSGSYERVVSNNISGETEYAIRIIVSNGDASTTYYDTTTTSAAVTLTITKEMSTTGDAKRCRHGSNGTRDDANTLFTAVVSAGDVDDYEYEWSTSNGTNPMSYSNKYSVQYSSTASSRTVSCTATHKTLNFEVSGNITFAVSNQGSATFPTLTANVNGYTVTPVVSNTTSFIRWETDSLPMPWVSGSSHTYTEPGTYTIYAYTNQGCMTSQNVTVPKLSITSNPNNSSVTMCGTDNAEVTYTADPVVGQISEYDYSWSITPTPQSSVVNDNVFVVAYSSTGTYTVSCTATLKTNSNSSLNSQMTTTTTRKNNPTFSTNADGLTVTLSDKTRVNTVSWLENADPVNNTSSYTYDAPGSYTITAYSSDGCITSKDVAVPSLSISSDNTNNSIVICGSDNATMTYTATPDAGQVSDYNSYDWSISPEPEAKTINDNVCVVTYSTAGTYTISCTATHNDGFEIEQSIETTTTNGNKPTLVLCQEDNSLQLLSFGDATYIDWGYDFPNQSSTPHTNEVTPNYPQGSYTVTIRNNAGCSSSKEVYFGVVHSFVPCVLSEIDPSGTHPAQETAATGVDANHNNDGLESVENGAITSITDYDGNVYSVVQIGSQCWLAENMRCTHSPSTGTLIVNPQGLSGNNAKGSCSFKTAHWYNNNPSQYGAYGLYYDWCAAVDTYYVAGGYNETDWGVNTTFHSKAWSCVFTETHRRGICPKGWHIPTDDEWNVMEAEVDGASATYTNTGYRGSHAGKLARDWCRWKSSDVTNAPGNKSANRNSSYFGAMNAGRYTNSAFVGSDDWISNAYFWSASSYNNDNAWSRRLTYNYPGVYRESGGREKTNGLSVRCLRDYEVGSSNFTPSATTDEASNLGPHTATLNGSIANANIYTISSKGFEYKASTASDYTQVLAGGNEFTYNLIGLAANTTYQYRAFAVYAGGTVYGEEVSFTTPEPVTVLSITPDISSPVSICKNGSTLGSKAVTYTAAVTYDEAPVNGYRYSWSVPSGLQYNTNGNTCTVVYKATGTTYAITCTATPDNNVGDPFVETSQTVLTTTDVSSLPSFTSCENDYGRSVEIKTSTNVDSYTWGGNTLSSSNSGCTYANDGVYVITANDNSNCTTTKMVAIGLATTSPCTVTSHHTNDAEYTPTTGGLETENNEGKVLTVQDQDGHFYAVVQIGDQCWMRSNLRTTTYSDGTTIPNGTPASGANTLSSTSPYRYKPVSTSSFNNYEFQNYNEVTDGLYYNWVAAMNGATSSTANPSGVQGVCPKGWHLPSDAEWGQMRTWVYNNRPVTNPGDQTAFFFCGGCQWNSALSTITYKPADFAKPDRNYSGFTALPVGYVGDDGKFKFYHITDNSSDNSSLQYSWFWSSCEKSGDTNEADNWWLYAGGTRLQQDDEKKLCGASVRCVRDAD